MTEEQLQKFGDIQRVKPQDLEKPKTGQKFNMDKIGKLSHEIAKIEHEKRDNPEG